MNRGNEKRKKNLRISLDMHYIWRNSSLGW